MAQPRKSVGRPPKKRASVTEDLAEDLASVKTVTAPLVDDYEIEDPEPDDEDEVAQVETFGPPMPPELTPEPIPSSPYTRRRGGVVITRG